MPYGDALPVLSGTTLPRPNAVGEELEQVGEDVTLANGSRRRYDAGERLTVTLSWGKLDETAVAALRAAAPRTATSYVHVDGRTLVVLPGRPAVTPIPGTAPVRFEVEIELVEQTPRRR